MPSRRIAHTSSVALIKATQIQPFDDQRRRANFNRKIAIYFVCDALAHHEGNGCHPSLLLPCLSPLWLRKHRAIMHDHSLDGGGRDAQVKLFGPSLANAVCDISIARTPLQKRGDALIDLFKGRMKALHRKRCVRLP